MDKKSIVNHLGLAVNGDEQQLKEKVKKLYQVLTRPTTRKPGRAIRKLKFVQTDQKTWQVILQRDDAKQVEEIWFDFVDRKNLDGEWRIEIENRKPKPTWRVGNTFCFTFFRVPEKATTAKRAKKKVEEKPTVATVMNKIATLSPEDKAAMLELLKQK